MKNKKVLVTGGNSGIGYSTAQLFKNRGYDVTISGRNKSALSDAARDLGIDCCVADMSNANELDALGEKFAEGIDVLINNAGVAQFLPIDLHTPEMIDQNFQCNVRGPMHLIQKLLPGLEKHGGSIVNVSSIIVENGKPNASLYAATKGAIEAMVRNLAQEFAPRGIRINAVSPGAIETPMMHKLGIPEELKPAMLEQQINAIPLKRLGNPNEVADVILSLAESSYVTGAIWKVDGGVNAS